MSGFVAKWLKFSLVALVGCGFLGMIIYSLVMRDEIRSAHLEPALIAAPTEPAKRRPDEPGGLDIPNQDKMVFDLLDASGTQHVPTEADMARMAETVSPAAGDVSDVLVEPTAAMEAPALVIEEQKPAPVVAAKVPEPVKVEPVAQVASVAPKAVAKVVEQLETKAVTKTVSGAWGVQLASVGSKADADKAGAKFASTLKGLSGLSPRVEAAAGRYRVQFAGLTSRADAAALCKRLSAQKQACFPVSIK